MLAKQLMDTYIKKNISIYIFLPRLFDFFFSVKEEELYLHYQKKRERYASLEAKMFLKCLCLSGQQSETHKYLIYHHKRKRKVNFEFLVFYLKNIKRFIYQKSNLRTHRLMAIYPLGPTVNVLGFRCS